MKKRTSTKMKNLSVLLALVMLIAAVFPNYALAADSPNDGIDLYSTLTDEDLSINAEVATCVAELFVKDMIATGTTVWNESTEPVNTVTMYDETGDTPTAYSVELTKGYVVVSAFVDMPSPILEWSDESEPKISEFGEIGARKIIYANALGYYVDDGDSTLTTLDGMDVRRNEVNIELTEMRSFANVPKKLQMDLFANRAAEKDIAMPLANDKGQLITDPYEYARNVYGEDFKNTLWYNEWQKNNEKYDFAITTDFWGVDSHCGPTAITNMIMMYGERYNDDGIPHEGSILPLQAIFLGIIQVNDAAGKIYYTNKSAKDGGGTKFSNSNEFIRKSFKKFGVTVSVSSSSLTPTTSNVQYATKYGKLMYISLSNCSPYTDSGYKHAVVGYAFCRLTNDAGSNLSFVKVCDGWSKTPTYVLLASLSKDRYWEVSF
ncbi:hypothetical protein [Acutalibacter sp. 1XD8-36]|uniref:hypothetical protein n=1 Tax=Acutalibacter sp. 1XD8-36 TaxID=2320852 RepID=UPI002625180D|nr:hypothetical protein [Acutalibacter sp. 1XD8-36]